MDFVIECTLLPDWEGGEGWIYVSSSQATKMQSQPQNRTLTIHVCRSKRGLSEMASLFPRSECTIFP